MLNALTVTTPTDREVVLSREFNAPRSLVFDALTTQPLLERWYGPTDWTLVVCDIDLRPGGAFRFVVRRPDGKEIGQRGVYREVVPGERLAYSESWEDWDAGETLVTTTLTEVDGTTIFTSRIVFPSREVRDTVVGSGLGKGAGQSYDKLADVLATAIAR
jgi:uncharacterized protein YndB with AHSA1/START domain